MSVGVLTGFMVPFWSYRIKPISLEKLTERYAKDELNQIVK